MKRVFLAAALFSVVLTTLSSCKKCYTCDFGNNDVREFCSKDFPDGTSGLQMTVDAYQEQGYQCSAK